MSRRDRSLRAPARPSSRKPAKVRIVGRQVYVDGNALPLAPLDAECPLPDPCKLMSESLAGTSHTIVLADSSSYSDETYEAFVEQGEVYLLGDNRDSSHDSRHHGPVAISDVVGVVTMVWWSSSDSQEE